MTYSNLKAYSIIYYHLHSALDCILAATILLWSFLHPLIYHLACWTTSYVSSSVWGFTLYCYIQHSMLLCIISTTLNSNAKDTSLTSRHSILRHFHTISLSFSHHPTIPSTDHTRMHISIHHLHLLHKIVYDQFQRITQTEDAPWRGAWAFDQCIQ